MSLVSYKTLKNNDNLQNEIVVQITKKQLINFFRFIVVLALISVNFIAISINSPLLKQLFISQIIFIALYFIKSQKSNTVLK